MSDAKPEVKPFRIELPQADLDDLRQRLRDTRWPDELPDAGWSRGVPHNYLRQLMAYWRDDYDWRAQEAELNQFAHFKANVDGLELHFIHERGQGPNPMPLLLLHGWPDSFYRMHKVIPMLTDPARFGGDPADAFDVIVPSIPGFGFSEAPGPGGSRVAVTAPRLLELMTRVLGYEQFGVAGGDGGSPLAQAMAIAAPQAVIGIHVTDIGFHQQLTTTPDDLSPAEQRFLTESGEAFMSGGGYVAIQGTRPQTLAYGLTDSPVGMAAWILDKFHDWSDCGDDFAQCYPADELLTNLSIYWYTGTIDSSIQGYYEELHEPSLRPGTAIPVPVGMALFPRDNPPPREFATRMLGRIDHWSEMPRGGHFTAWEAPAPFAADLRAFYWPLRSA